MSGVPSQSARLGSIGWAFHSFSGAKAAGGAGAPQKQSTSQTAGDIIDLSVARKSASGSAIKDRVLKVDGQIKTLTGQLKETHAALETAKGQREGLKKQLSEKLLESQQNQTETGGAEADRAKNEADIALLRQQVQALDVTIDGLKAQQQDLAGKAIALVGQNRQAYDEANGGKN